jgi:hypothetical protein
VRTQRYHNESTPSKEIVVRISEVSHALPSDVHQNEELLPGDVPTDFDPGWCFEPIVVLSN